MPAKKSKKGKARTKGKKAAAFKKLGSVKSLRAAYPPGPV